MTLNFDLSTVLQSLTVLLIAGIAKVVYSTSVAMAALHETMKGHAALDVASFAEVRADIKEAKDEAKAASDKAARIASVRGRRK
jgi:hypothetical protein